MKICSKCKVSRPLDEFHNDRRHADGKNIWCKFCKDEWTLNQGKPFDSSEDEQQPKTCYTCKRTLRLVDFHRDKRRPDGRAPNCRECVKTTYLRSGLQRPRENELRTCSKCKTERPVSDFPRDRSRADGIGVRCKPCGRAAYAANAGTIQAKHKEWKDRNYDKMAIYWQDRSEKRFFYARAKNHCGSAGERINQLERTIEIARLWKQQRGVCAITGRRLSAENAQLDHIIPRTKGGDDSISNLRWVHRDVNYAKRDLTDEVFLQLCLDVVDHRKLQSSGVIESDDKGRNGNQHVVDLAEVDTATVEQSAGEERGELSGSLQPKGHGYSEPSRRKAEGATTIPQGSRAKRSEAPRVPLGR